MGTSKILKWVTGGLEILLGIPVLGGAIVLGLAWTPLAVMLVLHIITLIFSNKEHTSKTGSIVGIITSCVAWIPFVGMIMHIISGILLLIAAAKKDHTNTFSS
ncbi:hypothetical protein [Paenibacillus sedimenti]|uniref:Uncharacterized protein n=1 Tax=Paenibacillus sedimenti TaxID=2770274 RepID=A0A926KWG5_9BACL|nr:hypothetical protein [Paenibacillus sedimenti]MBD0383483.1 hypothetical protein [Paenibacillus sedimenti]